MAFSGDRVYLDGAIYDISNPASPVLLGQIPTSYYPYGGIALSGSYAFLAVNGQGLLVYDLSDPANPQKVAQKSTDPHFGGGGFGFGITVSGNYAYVATYTNCGVQVFDISTPTNPVSAFCVSTYAFDVRVFGNYAYPISTTTYFLIYNVSNPTNISAATEYVRTSDNVYTGAISGDYAYFGMGEYGITVYSLGIPPPTLSIAQTSTNTLLFSWPTPTTAFLLQQKPSLATGGWVTLTNLPATTASKNEVLIPAPAATTFYRLIPQ